MVIIKSVNAKSILDSRGEKTISVSIKTNAGRFSASSPNGKSTGKYEVKLYKKTLEDDIQTLAKFSDYFSEEVIETFDDLKRIEDILDRHVGGNTILALECAVLKALAREQKKEIWELIGISQTHSDSSGRAQINPNTKKFPRLVGNCVGGGKHSDSEKKPDFQEFLLIPKTKSVKKSFEENKKTKEKIKESLKTADKNFKGEKNDENAWRTSLNEKEVLDVLKNAKVPLGLDIAASSFFKRKKYKYANPKLDRDADEQLSYVSNLIRNYDLLYIEDAFDQEDFENFAKLVKKFPDRLIVGDDLVVTNSKRLKKAIDMKSVNAIIVKPNQCGSLLEVKRVCELAKENSIKTVFSHRSGETDESILADIAFGFGADFFKCGIDGREREAKLKRLVEIEGSLK